MPDTGDSSLDETGLDETGDSAPEDTGPEDTGPEDTGPEDTGPEDTGPEDTGPGDSDTDTGDPTETGDSPEVDDTGLYVGAAGLSGELGGCGCTASAAPGGLAAAGMWLMVLGLARRRG